MSNQEIQAAAERFQIYQADSDTIIGKTWRWGDATFGVATAINDAMTLAKAYLALPRDDGERVTENIYTIVEGNVPMGETGDYDGITTVFDPDRMVVFDAWNADDESHKRIVALVDLANEGLASKRAKAALQIPTPTTEVKS
jgi:hypothetical protein